MVSSDVEQIMFSENIPSTAIDAFRRGRQQQTDQQAEFYKGRAYDDVGCDLGDGDQPAGSHRGQTSRTPARLRRAALRFASSRNTHWEYPTNNTHASAGRTRHAVGLPLMEGSGSVSGKACKSQQEGRLRGTLVAERHRCRVQVDHLPEHKRQRMPSLPLLCDAPNMRRVYRNTPTSHSEILARKPWSARASLPSVGVEHLPKALIYLAIEPMTA
ncbi:hypothetical protein CPLU01_04606 [Colletotrichum plurivorum]|uniref:Uncharacterized protein n=1 Tax=Colletotrichum plurivorum TaxID=2175906 RepID=A0A8H6KNS3_9PEZI|nr:hypothetical protein CPLU01_04606 [Colletotrichum plurivorum]